MPVANINALARITSTDPELVAVDFISVIRPCIREEGLLFIIMTSSGSQ